MDTLLNIHQRPHTKVKLNLNKDSRYISNLFITCSKNDEDYTPKLIHKIGTI